MRALATEFESGSPTESFLMVLDQFAALRTYTSDAPSVGGYRVLYPRRSTQAKRTPSAAAIAALARARMRLTGFLAVLFVGGLGLAVLAGPANCPCANAFTTADETSLARLGYVQGAGLLTTRESATELPVLATATLLEPESKTPDTAPLAEPHTADAAAPAAARTAAVPSVETKTAAVPSVETSPAGVSSITTSALEPLHAPLDAVTAVEVAGSNESAHKSPDPVRLAAAESAETDVPRTLPSVEVSTPPRMEITATEADDARPSRPTVKLTRKRTPKRVTRAYRSPTTVKKKVDPTAPTPPPKWAQQMFTNPWQSQAFSYTR